MKGKQGAQLTFQSVPANRPPLMARYQAECLKILTAQGAPLRKALRSDCEVDRFGVQVRDRLLVEGLSAGPPS
jgi:hypothetical protein